MSLHTGNASVKLSLWYFLSMNDVCKHYSKWCSVFFRVLVSLA